MPMATPAEAASAPGNISASSNNVPAAGENLPPATGLDHTIERLQAHISQNTHIQGLNNALQMQQRNSKRSGSRIETNA